MKHSYRGGIKENRTFHRKHKKCKNIVPPEGDPSRDIALDEVKEDT